MKHHKQDEILGLSMENNTNESGGMNMHEEMRRAFSLLSGK